ncbi:MAG: Rne/Rng family ribonuclease [Terracidiphilus sp.]|jgi:ribonuclease G
MAKEICISSTPHETRLAILEDDQLAEIYYERENEYTLAGSIYNGRVTRVLPGMQSAFVDVGLERDAFLYVTDFLELEDAEETDEIEKAAASGGGQPPREVRHSPAPDGTNGRGDARQRRPGQKLDQKPDQKQESRPERPTPEQQPKERRFAVEAIPDAVPQTSIAAEPAEGAQEDSTEPGAKRWRGRRRRRGGRGGSVGTPEGQAGTNGSEETAESYADSPAEAEVAPVIHAAATWVSGDAPTLKGAAAPTALQGREAAPPARAGHAPVPFVLPGESLSKYGGVPEDEFPKSAPAASAAPPARPASSFKPATLIEAPIQWDGSGLLPGESISRHRGRQPESAAEAEPLTIEAGAIQGNDYSPDEFEEEELVSEQSEASPLSATEPAAEDHLVEEEQLGEEEYAKPVAEARPAEDHLVEEDDFVEEEQLRPIEETPFGQTNAATFDAPVAEEELALPALAEVEDKQVEAAIEEPAAPSASETAVDSAVKQGEAAAGIAPDAPPAADPEAAEDEAINPAATVEPETEAPEAPMPESTQLEADRAASHRVDPLPPSTFRLFGLGGKKKAEEPAPEAVKPPSQPAPVASVSAYAPGSGNVEEEIIEGDEFDAPRHPRGKAEEHDIDDLEEETLPPQMRTGDLGEMLQEAHLDHRILLNFDEKNGEDDEAFDEDEDESAADQPSTVGGGQGQPQQPRDRGMRGRRGRGPQGAQGNRRGPSRRSMQTSDMPIISDLLKPNQEILVQIAKEPIAKKGARITSHIALPGRFLVFMPTVSHIGVSRKIAAEEERQRLKRILVHERGDASGGFIVRTAAEGASEEDLRTDLRMLIHTWNEIKQRSDESKSPALIYHDFALIERILRDQVSANFSAIWVDSETDYERIVRFLNRFSPTLVRRVKLYTKETPLFEHFGIQDEISKALRSKVWLKSGGSIVINQTEALVAIDINTGKYVGKSARLEDTIVKTNLDAVPEIVRQIRLRDLGGIIVIDFIDMDDRKNRYKVMAALEEALKSDRAPTKVLQFNDFGLVAITRKRHKQSLERTLSVPCPTCQATGMVKSPTTVCNEIYVELRKMRKHFEGADVLLRVNPETVKVLKGNGGSWLSEFEELVGKNILVKSDPTLHPEQFDIQG